MPARRDSERSEPPEVAEVLSAEPIGEASAGDVVEAVPGFAVAQQLDEGRQVTAGGPQTNGKLANVIECMLFVSTEPLNSKQLAEAIGRDQQEIDEAVAGLEASLDEGRGLQLMRVAGGFQLCTRPEYADCCAAILRPAHRKLSRAALETLAIVAYRQPCTLPEIEAVRGVSADWVMKTLLDRGLIRECGRKQTPGRPILYATTPQFLEHFGMNDLSELPDIDMLAVEEVRALEAQRDLLREQE